MKTLHLEEQESLELIKYYTKELEKIDERRMSIIKILSQLNASVNNREVSETILTKRGEIVEAISSFGSNSSYNPEWSWTQKITYVLKNSGTSMTKKEILRELKRLDHGIASDFNLAQRSVGATLSRQTKNGKFKLNEDAGTNFNAYALPEWYEKGELNI